MQPACAEMVVTFGPLREWTASNLRAGHSVSEGLGNDLQVVLENHKSNAILANHRHRVTVGFQDAFQFVHPGNALGRGVAEPGDASRLAPIVAFRCGAIEPRWRGQAIPEPRELLLKCLTIVFGDVGRVFELIRDLK